MYLPRTSRRFTRYGLHLLTAAACVVGFLPGAANAGAAKPVIAAYVFPRDTLLTQDQVDAQKLTRVNYAFSNISGGRMVEGHPEDASNLAVLHALKLKNPQLTVLVSVGGWLWSTGFSDMALTSTSRSAFIESVDNFVTRYELDGLDIDWEYPGLIGSGHPFRPEDKHNYTLLMKELRLRFTPCRSGSIESSTSRLQPALRMRFYNILRWLRYKNMSTQLI